MTQCAMRVENLSKRYRIGRTPTSPTGGVKLLKRLTSPFQYLVNTLSPPTASEIISALDEVSFEVDRGEVIGLIGRNGAGKSTLLKILSRITEPTSGSAILYGRVGSLLEVGTGFHPELTGRENIFLSGAVIGMKRAEIGRKFDEMVAFAEVEKFLDTPVKRYSSGMYVRLAFAVAAHLEPEILLVDEVLAVGDAAFQKKCLGKMGDVANQGRTVLFVSHNMVAVQNLCQRAVWLENGRVRECGEVGGVVSRYLSDARQVQTEQIWPDSGSAPGNEKVRIRRVCIRPDVGLPTDSFTMETPLAVEVEYWNLIPNTQLHICWRLFTEEQAAAFSSASHENDSEVENKLLPKGLFRSVCHISGNLLNEGMHRLRLLVVQNAGKVIYRYDDVLAFEVLNDGKRPGFRYSREMGAVRPMLDWTTECLSEL